MTLDLRLVGGSPDAAGLGTVVAAFRATSAVVAGLVLPWDRPATREDLDLDPAGTTGGVLWSADGECRWRVEGDRTHVTVLLDVPLVEGWVPPDGVRTEVVPGVEAQDGRLSVAWARPPFSVSGGPVRLVERRYLTATDGPVHRRLRPLAGVVAPDEEA